MPWSLLGRLIVRILAFEWFASLALILTVAALVFAFARSWGWVALGGFGAVATWGYVVYDEIQARRDQRLSVPQRESDG
jgi:hypothetical protein